MERMVTNEILSDIESNEEAVEGRKKAFVVVLLLSVSFCFFMAGKSFG